MNDTTTQTLTSNFSKLTLQIHNLKTLKRFYHKSFDLKMLTHEDDRM